MTDVHVIYTDLTPIGGGWDISTPQAPGLFAGYPTAEEAAAATEGLLDFAGLAAGSYRLWRHEQKFVTSPAGDEFYVRFYADDPDARDDHSDLRGSAAGREMSAIEKGHVELDRMPTLPTGERLIIAVTPTDRLGWVLDQLGAGEGAIASYYGGNDAVWSCPIFDGDREHGRGTPLEELGLTRESTIGEVMDRVIAGEASELSAHLAAALV